ncbi:hypothetical protein Vretimale_8728 [Volvox reticuliferus]|uniref:Cleft lip and palate associated transmembrane protein n=1 Tax=Volvox reticuliferus TaxID=1737510 RepID=A0A8J4FMF4_9CHLO|nr:hypothetical protein Vretifemale_6269 [Volvox reticuliferus]GIM04099.1 hypothetical protein Vretimale_8728 [Volvox reticuliferus]
MADNGVALAGAAGAAADAAAPALPGQQRQQQGGLGQILGMILRVGVMMYFFNSMKGNKPPPREQQGQQVDGIGEYTYPAFKRGTTVDMHLFLTENFRRGHRIESSELIWSEEGVMLGDTALKRKSTYIYKPSNAVKNNGSAYLLMVLAKEGAEIFSDLPSFNPVDVAYYPFQLNVYRKRPRNTTGVSLLSDNPLDAPKVEKEDVREIISYIRPNVTLQLVDYFQAHARKSVPPQISEHLRMNSAGDYEPIVYFNDFWLLRDKLVPVNETLDNVTLHLELSYVTMTWWQLLQQMDQSFGMQVNMGLAQDDDRDELKRMFLEGNPILLGVTFVVSLLHTVFDLLAFKNDIGFWKNNKSMEGLSARTVMINAFCQVVILLYLFDNETSFVVLLSSALGTAIELWKVTKAFEVSFNRERFPYIIVKDRASYSNKQTKKYDAEAMRYLSYALYPLVFGYSIYSLIYKKHKSWYSWILSSLVGAVYMFGFILMCPQLYLNYKLKSVAHLPWRQLTYKFLNTIIDDLFAFVIKMPLLHRLSVFRDDLVFVIYLYQRWIYRVDKSRANEFGWSEEQPAEAAAANDNGAPQLGGAEPPAEEAVANARDVLQPGTPDAVPEDDNATEEADKAWTQARKRKGGKGAGKGKDGAGAGTGTSADTDSNEKKTR